MRSLNQPPNPQCIYIYPPVNLIKFILWTSQGFWGSNLILTLYMRKKEAERLNHISSVSGRVTRCSGVLLIKRCAGKYHHHIPEGNLFNIAFSCFWNVYSFFPSAWYPFAFPHLTLLPLLSWILQLWAVFGISNLVSELFLWVFQNVFPYLILCFSDTCLSGSMY